MTNALPVSLAMGTCNGARYIAEQLASLARQTQLPAELVITDDASTDNTLEIVAAFAAKSPFPVRVEKNAERLGYRGNFMKAAGLCRSPLIGFCDQDDVWLPNKLAACSAAFDRADILMTYHNATVTSGSLDPIGALTAYAAPQETNPPHSMDPWLYGLGFTLVFRRSLMDFQKLWPQSVDYNEPSQPEAHDQWFCFLASTLGTVRYLAEPLVLYRQHGANTCGWSGSSSWTRIWRNLAATAVSDIQLRQSVAANRAHLLEDMNKSLSGTMRDNAKSGAAGYRTLAARYQARGELYKTVSIFSKIQTLATLALKGGYVAKSRWGVGRQALARDVVCGVLSLPRSRSSETV